MLLLLGTLALGFLSLASTELRSSSRGDQAGLAKANARLALMHAIGQLQRSLGPDQRISASAEILRKPVAQSHWTGVWRSTSLGEGWTYHGMRAADFAAHKKPAKARKN